MAKKAAKRATKVVPHKNAPKVHYKYRKQIADEAVDAYKREHHLEEYTPQQQISTDTQQVAPGYPSYVEIIEPMMASVNVLGRAVEMTIHEARQQELEMAHFHLRIARRYINSAFSE